jgi:hypothetical protein
VGLVAGETLVALVVIVVDIGKAEHDTLRHRLLVLLLLTTLKMRMWAVGLALD